MGGSTVLYRLPQTAAGLVETAYLLLGTYKEAQFNLLRQQDIVHICTYHGPIICDAMYCRYYDHTLLHSSYGWESSILEIIYM